MPQRSLKYHAPESALSLLSHISTDRGHKVTRFWKEGRCETVLVEERESGTRVGKFTFRRGDARQVLVSWFPGLYRTIEARRLVRFLELEGEAASGLM